MLLHPEWNPGVVEQQIGRIDRVGSRWSQQLDRYIKAGLTGADISRIEVRARDFSGHLRRTQLEGSARTLGRFHDDLTAQRTCSFCGFVFDTAFLGGKSHAWTGADNSEDGKRAERRQINPNAFEHLTSPKKRAYFVYS